MFSEHHKAQIIETFVTRGQIVGSGASRIVFGVLAEGRMTKRNKSPESLPKAAVAAANVSEPASASSAARDAGDTVTTELESEMAKTSVDWRLQWQKASRKYNKSLFNSLGLEAGNLRGSNGSDENNSARHKKEVQFVGMDVMKDFAKSLDKRIPRMTFYLDPRGNALSTNSRGHVHHPLCTGHPQRVQHAAPGGASDVSTSSWDSVSIPDGGSDSSFLVVDPWEPISLPQRPRGFESLVNMEELNHSIPCESSSVVSDSSWIDVLESEEHKD